MARKYLIEIPEDHMELDDEKKLIIEGINDYLNWNIPLENIIRADILKKSHY